MVELQEWNLHREESMMITASQELEHIKSDYYIICMFALFRSAGYFIADCARHTKCGLGTMLREAGLGIDREYL